MADHPPPAGDLRVEMIDLGDQLLRVGIKSGSADKIPLMLFNGIGANLELGIPFIRELGDTPAFIFDVPGVGGSPMPRRPYRPATMARMARRLCTHLGYAQVDVAGVSWGGGPAQEFARQYPETCRRLVLVSTCAGWATIIGNPRVLSRMASIKRYTDKNYMRTIAPDIYGGDFRKDATLINMHAEAMRPASNAGYMLQLLAILGWTSLPWLPRLQQKTLVMAGADDPLIPVAKARTLARAIPDARLEVVDNGHLFVVTRPAETANTILAFLAE